MIWQWVLFPEKQVSSKYLSIADVWSASFSLVVEMQVTKFKYSLISKPAGDKSSSSKQDR